MANNSTVPFNSREVLHAARLRKSNKQSYLQLVSDLEGKEYTVYYHTLEIGCLGHYEQCTLNCIKRIFNLLKYCWKKLLLKLSKTTTSCSYYTFNSRNSDHGMQISPSTPHSPLSEGHQYITRCLSIYFVFSLFLVFSFLNLAKPLLLKAVLCPKL